MKEFTTDFIPVPFVAIKDKNLTPLSRMVLGIIYYITEKRGDKFFMSNKYIANILDSKSNSINNCILNLEENGYIKREYNEDNTQRLEIKCLIKVQKLTSTNVDLTSVEVDITLDKVDLTLTSAHNKINNKIPNEINKKELMSFFDEIRIKHKQKLKGKARGLETEWKDFIRKHPKADTFLLEEMKLGASRYFKAEFNKDEAFKYTPNFKTWYNQSRWEEYTQQ
tara:strand:- start:861 stop:1532 length:672 start_codon:yes stop_codon:yes gene_type:complete